MEEKIHVKVIIDEREIDGIFYLKTNPLCMLSLFIDGEQRAEVSGDDFFSCFCELRKRLKDIVFLCKGAKVNVYPSRMSRQMASGIKAYEVTLGQPALRENLVNIFDYDDEGFISSPQEQHGFHLKWISSLG